MEDIKLINLGKVTEVLISTSNKKADGIYTKKPFFKTLWYKILGKDCESLKIYTYLCNFKLYEASSHQELYELLIEENPCLKRKYLLENGVIKYKPYVKFIVGEYMERCVYFDSIDDMKKYLKEVIQMMPTLKEYFIDDEILMNIN